MSSSEIIEEFELMALEKLSPNSKREYLYNLKEFDRFLSEKGKSLLDPKAADLAEWLRFKKQTCKGSTLARKFSAIKKFFLFLRKKKLINPDELEYLSDIQPKKTKGDEAHRALSEIEIQKCFSNITHPLFQFIYFLGLNFGVRREEYTNIQVSDINLERKRLRIHGKGDKVRFIPITERQRARIERFLEHRKRDGVTHEYLLYSKTGKILKRTLERYFSEMSKLSGVKFTSHDLRVTFATRLWNAGLDIYVISKKLGHESIETTLRYVKPTEKQVDERYLEIADDLV